MARKIRYILPEIPHHAIQRGNNRQKIFVDRDDRRSFLQNLEQYGLENKVNISAYCLMTNHVHLLLCPQTEEGLVTFMKLLSQVHSQRMNRKYQRSGKFWENRYKLHMVDPNYEWVVARYIELNPVRAKMIDRAEDYEYSSARAHLSGQADKILTKDIVGPEIDAYRKFMSEKEAQDAHHLRRIREVIQQEKILGSIEFIRKVEMSFKTVFAVRPRGRPKLSSTGYR